MEAVRICLDRISKKFSHRVKGEVSAVSEVSLQVQPGEFLTLLGPSGCGKTTTLRMVAGFERPDIGRIYIGEEDVTDNMANQRNIGFVFQNYALFPHPSVFENVAYGLRVKGMGDAQIEKAVTEVLALAGLKGYERQFPHQLSGGEQQPVALARAVIIQPRVLLFYEPRSNLDAKLRLHMRSEIRRLQKALSITAIYVLGTVAVMIMVPSDRINLVTGIIQAIQIILEKVGIPSFTTLVAFLLMLGGLGTLGVSGSGSPFAGRLWLAPLTVGGNLPFRRLCVAFGAEVTVGEMSVVRRLRQGRGAELALLRSHAEEPLFGAQIADSKPESLAEGARLGEERGARFVDLNCGCPIDTMTRRGLGASLLRRPARLGRLVEAMRRAVAVPVTVKLRLGWMEGAENVSEVARACEEAGAAAITIHDRTREQRYSRAADWEVIGRVAAERGVPVAGNGDLLTHYEARERRARSGVTSLMLARGALIKPWLFREIHEGRSIFSAGSESLV